jgi:hypothetical protein
VVFSGDRPKDYKFIIEAADRDENIRVPAAANITDEMRNIMPLTPDWTYWPDYERVRMTNTQQRPGVSLWRAICSYVCQSAHRWLTACSSSLQQQSPQL